MSTITGSFYRTGKCEYCGNPVERARSFRGATSGEIERQADKWAESPIWHLRCGGV